MSRKLLHLLCLSCLVLSSPLLAQSAWTKAPQLPRACYSGEDTHWSEGAAALSDLEALIEKQDLINRGIMEQIMNMDQATLQQRMMAAVQRNPARTQEILEATQYFATAQGQADLAAAGAEESEFATRKAKLTEDYKADKARVMSLYTPRTPAQLEASQRTSGGVDGTDPAVIADNNEKYRTVLCPKWFGKEIPALLAWYRTYLTDQWMPALTKGEVASVRLAEMFGVPVKDFRPLAEMKAVAAYLKVSIELFGLRESEPIKSVDPE